MKNVFGTSSRLVLTALLGVSLTAWLSLGPVDAQGKMKKDTKKSADKMMKDDHKMSDDHMKMMDEDDVLPASVSYPMASPGALDLAHWTDYTHKHLKMGTASTEKMDKMKSGDHKMMMDEDDVLPASVSYPMAPPGALDLAHWTDYTQKHLKPGSASMDKMDKMHDTMKKDTMKKDSKKK
jgi:hypothetical protein